MASRLEDGDVGGRLRPRAVAEGAVLAALTVVLVLMTAMIPVAGLLAALAIPTPTVVLVVRHDWRTALLSSVVVALLLFAFLGVVGAMSAWIQAAGIGVPLGLGLKQRWPPWKSLAVTTLVFLLLAAIGILMTLYISGFHPIEVALTSYRAAGQWAYEVYDRAGILPPGMRDRAAFLAWWESVVETVATLLPVGLLMGYAGFALLTYALNKAVLERLGHAVPAVTPFARWQLPPWALLALAGVFTLAWLLPQAGIRVGDAVILNLLGGGMLLFMVNGAATGYAFLLRWRLSRLAAAAVLVGAVLFGLALPLAWLGMLDAALRLRERYGLID